MSMCHLCPRSCGTNREQGKTGYCGETAVLRIARAALHFFEEPPISGKSGSGAVFFTGCNLRCVFCQNYQVSHDDLGFDITPDELKETLFRLSDEGAANINLVTPTHFSDAVAGVLADVKPALGIPVVWNSSGYESPETLRSLAGLVDIFLPDFKYVSPELSADYSGAPDYCEVATRALRTMYELVGDPVFDGDGMMKKGMIVRHLVLPGCRGDSIAVLHKIAETVPVTGIKLSLMSQYTPAFAGNCDFPNLHRRVTSFEYDTVLAEAERLGFDGYFQRRSSASPDYTPLFTGDGRRRNDRPISKN